jgi:prepilin-type processing-associated H-X9-DG protein
VTLHAVADPTATYPEYIPDLGIYICPSDPSAGTDVAGGLWNFDVNNDGLGDAEGNVDVCAVTAASYVYIPWAIDPGDIDQDGNLTSFTAFVAAATQVILAHVAAWPDSTVYDNDLTVDLDGPGPLEEELFPRLREGIERFFVTDINNPGASARSQSEVTIAFDTISTVATNFNHIPGGSNVLRLDGHVDFNRYPGEFPVSEQFAQIAQFFGNS